MGHTCSSTHLHEIGQKHDGGVSPLLQTGKQKMSRRHKFPIPSKEEKKGKKRNMLEGILIPKSRRPRSSAISSLKLKKNCASPQHSKKAKPRKAAITHTPQIPKSSDKPSLYSVHQYQFIISEPVIPRACYKQQHHHRLT